MIECVNHKALNHENSNSRYLILSSSHSLLFLVVYLKVLHEFVVQHRARTRADVVQERLQPLTLAVIGTIGAHDVELFETKVGLDRSQGLHLLLNT